MRGPGSRLAGRPFDIRDNPDRASQKDTGARWTIKYSKKKESAPKGCVDIAIPHYGFKSHIMIDRSRSFIRSLPRGQPKTPPERPKTGGIQGAQPAPD